jgi:hypothetical protein
MPTVFWRLRRNTKAVNIAVLEILWSSLSWYLPAYSPISQATKRPNCSLGIEDMVGQKICKVKVKVKVAL